MVGLRLLRSGGHGDGGLFQGIDRRISQTNMTPVDPAGFQTDSRGWSQKVGELLPGQVYSDGIDYALLSVPKRLGSSSIQKAQLLIGPDGGNSLGIGHPNAGTTAFSLPVLNALDLELGEDLIDSGNEVIHLFSSVPGSDCEPQPFLAASDGGVVDGLDVDSVVSEQGIRSDLGQNRVSDQNRNDMGRTGTE